MRETVTPMIEAMAREDEPVRTAFVAKGAFVIEDEKSASWLVRELRKIEDEEQAVKAATAERLEQLESDRARLMHLYGDQLRQWAEGEAKTRRRKTVTLPLAGASLTFRSVAASVVVEDLDAADPVARSLMYMKPATIDLAAYRKASAESLETRGRLLPGCKLIPAHESFSISFPAKDRSSAAKKGEKLAPPTVPTE